MSKILTPKSIERRIHASISTTRTLRLKPNISGSKTGFLYSTVWTIGSMEDVRRESVTHKMTFLANVGSRNGW